MVQSQFLFCFFHGYSWTIERRSK